MIRVEIILDQTIEDILMEAFNNRPALKRFTLISPVKGNGAAGPKMGDHVWPEENSLFILYTAEKNKGALRGIIKQIREDHPHNGVAMFITPGAEEL